MELQDQIRELLAKFDYISLPELGSFVKTYQSAKLSPDGKSFLPPRQSITFDTSRTFNDEVLDNLVMEKLHVERHEAQTKVRDFVEEVRKSMAKKEGASFKNVGVLRQDERGNIIFEEADDFSKASATFGLNPLTIPEKKPQTVTRLQEKPIAQTAQVVKPSPKKGKLIAITVMAAVVVLAIAFSAAFLFIPELRFWEKSDSALVLNQQSTAIEHTPEYKGSLEEGEENQMAETAGDHTDGSDDLGKTINAQTKKKKALYYEEVKQYDESIYYIISGSFVNMENAQKHCRYLESKGYKPEIIEDIGKYRVAMSKFTDKNRALRELERIRREKPTESVWLLGL